MLSIYPALLLDMRAAYKVSYTAKSKSGKSGVLKPCPPSSGAVRRTAHKALKIMVCGIALAILIGGDASNRRGWRRNRPPGNG